MNSYGALAWSYDALTGDVDYAAWADYIERHFARTGLAVSTVVDLACGTGSLTAVLAGRGYDMIGVDLSETMLAVAADKCAGLEPRPLLIRQDMSRLRLYAPADAVVCCLDSLNYVTRPKAVQRTFGQVWKYLKEGGLFLFDIRTPSMLQAMDGELCLDETEDAYCVWRGAFSRRRRILTYYMDLFRRNGDGTWERDGELHEEYAYEPEELEAYLAQAGFRDIRQYGELSMRKPKENAQRIFFTARKG